MSDNAPDPENLRALGKRLDDVQRQRAANRNRPPPTPMGIAFRFAAEMMSALLVGGGIGWGLDWVLGRYVVNTHHIFLIALFIIGAAAGILNVVRAAKEINAEVTASNDKGN